MFIVIAGTGPLSTENYVPKLECEMLLNPKKNQPVQLWYKNKAMPYHGQLGRIVIISRGKPRNHGVEINGRIVVVPCGNLRIGLRQEEILTGGGAA